jgi:hypothetical protein
LMTPSFIGTGPITERRWSFITDGPAGSPGDPNNSSGIPA